MRTWGRACIPALLCGALAALCLPAAPVFAQAPESLDRIKQRIDAPASRLKPSGPLELRPTFKSGVEKHPFVPTLEEHLRKTFELTDFQRKYADYAAAAGGFDLGMIFRAIDKSLQENRTRKVREEIARELRELEAARKASNR